MCLALILRRLATLNQKYELFLETIKYIYKLFKVI